jgi:hypothetical protein
MQLDISELNQRGFHTARGFFDDPDLKRDLEERGREVVRLREEGKLTVDSQDTMGLPYEWFEPLVKHPRLIETAVSVLGPDVVASCWRVLAKDKLYQKSVHVHQDWAYNPGDTNKLTVFLPLTPVNPANGGLIFVEGSHFYGPVSQGPIDLSRFPPMPEEEMDAVPGDAVFCDFLTWHYSNAPQNDADRIMIQINYQPAGDPSHDNVVAGRKPHDKKLYNRLDAVSVPSVELNRVRAQKALEQGDLDRATRYAKGLLFDDPEHVGAALLLHDILWRDKDPEALAYLEKARGALERFQAQIDARDAGLGLAPRRSTPGAAAAAVAGSSLWKPVAAGWKSHIPEHPVDPVATGTIVTPQTAWAYGASGDLIETDKPTTVRISARALKGKIGFALLTEDYSNLASDAHVITPESGEASVMIAFKPENSPARLLVRNHDDEGVAGEVAIRGVEMMDVV